MPKNDLLIAWLNDAYAMEQSQQAMLKRFVKDFEDFPEIQAKLEQHIQDAREEAGQMNDCIEHLGGKLSKTKSMLGNIVGALQGMSTAPYKDQAVKDLLIWHATEHFEHAAHAALAAGARACSENEIATICERIAQEEKATADWTEQQIPVVVTSVIEKQRIDAAAP
jgi:ferritin-like metal-binding protein YciE